MPEQEVRPLEFKIENGDVYFIEGAMPHFIHYGKLFTAVQTETENQFEIKKFDIAAQEYKHSDELTSFEIYGQAVDVVDGFATAIPPTPIPEPPQPLSEQEETQLEIAVNVEYLVCMEDLGL